MRISKDCPAIYDRLHSSFGVEWDDGIIIAYHPVIYCKLDIAPEKIVHEMIHLKEQEAIGVELWYDMYIAEDGFRFDQELKAYRAEYAFLKRHIKNREHLFKMKVDICRHMSSSMYGNMVALDEAMKMIG